MTLNEIETATFRRSDDLVLVAKKLGYDTFPHQFACANGANVSGLLNFFDDNPGAMEAVAEWIIDNLELEDDPPQLED